MVILDEKGGREIEIAVIVLSIIAAMFVTIRLVVQFISPVFATKSMRLQFQYCLVLFAHYVILVVGRFLDVNSTECFLSAILELYLHLTFHTWLLILSLDMYENVRSLVNRASGQGDQKTRAERFREIAVHTVIGWGANLPVLALAIGLYYTDDIDDKFKLLFGEHDCFTPPAGIEHFPYYVTPVIASTINLVVFALTAVFLRKAFKRRRHLTQTNRRNYTTYVKLFIVMGGGYTLTMLTPFFPTSVVLWLLIIIAHAFQGIYVTLAFVCTQKVWQSLQQGNSIKIGNTREQANVKASKTREEVDASASASGEIYTIQDRKKEDVYTMENRTSSSVSDIQRY